MGNEGKTATRQHKREYAYNEDLHREIVLIGRSKEKGTIVNQLSKDDVTTIIATMDFFGATDIYLRQTYFDLTVPRFRVFDWIAMGIMSRNDDNREQNNIALKVLVHSYLKTTGDVSEFIDDLRKTDYDIDHSWEKINIDICEGE